MNIALLGYGKMGKAIESLASERGHSIVLKINDNIDNHNIRTTDVAIDFSIPEAAVKNISHCFIALQYSQRTRLIELLVWIDRLDWR